MCSPRWPHALLSHKLSSMFVVSRVCFILSIGLKSNHTVIGYPPKSHITIAPLGTSCLMSHCCSRRSLQLSKIVDEFSPSVAHILPSSIRKEHQQGGSSQFTSSMISRCPATQGYGVYKRILSLRSINQEQWHYSASLWVTRRAVPEIS